MNKFFIFLLTVILSSVSAHADDSTTLQEFTKLLQAKDYASAKQYVTADSAELFDRYTRYDLGSSTPAYSKVISKWSNNDYRYLKVSTTGTPPKATNVAFITENDVSKIDLPETLRLGFGPNWQQKINSIEQTYLLARQNFGEEQSLQMLNVLLRKQ